MRYVFFAAAAICAATPVNAFTMRATFSTIATGGNLSLRYAGPANYPSNNDMAGKTFNIRVNAITIPEDPFYGNPAKIIGDFDADSPDVVPDVARYAYGRAYTQGGVVTLTDSLFTYTLYGEGLFNNSYGTITLVADRAGTVLSNWRGSFSGSIEFRVADPVVPYNYAYQNVTFVATTANVQIHNLAGVPEPATWAMIITGFGAAGMAARRRRSLADEALRV